MKKTRVAVLGATGMIGQRFVQMLEDHPYFEIEGLYASERSEGKKLSSVLKIRDHIFKEETLAREIEVMDLKKIASNSRVFIRACVTAVGRFCHPIVLRINDFSFERASDEWLKTQRCSSWSEFLDCCSDLSGEPALTHLYRLWADTPMRAATSATEYPRSVTCLTASSLNSGVNLGVPITASYAQRIGTGCLPD